MHESQEKILHIYPPFAQYKSSIFSYDDDMTRLTKRPAVVSQMLSVDTI